MAAVATRGMIDARRLARIRWRCRRGLLENDIVLSRYLDAKGDRLDECDAAALDKLLELPDDDLWALIAGRTTTDDESLSALLNALRSS
ncbi:MAG TPA: succinate dehydrogenase assembly factor 2 [Casimicrobiaceae bacterium]|nr:succinate dehydrogenase assembly factor 2 [Casimicrobiaceae bacterium]